MPTKNPLPAPRFEFWRNSKKEFNYRTIGRNGTSIGGEQHQGFKNKAGILNNIVAHAWIFGVSVTYEDLNNSFVTQGGIEIPLIEVKK